MSTEPTWLTIARAEIGVAETPGPATTPRIAAWLKRLKASWRDDETPWCGVFVGACLGQAGIPIPKLYMRAKAWADWGSLLPPGRLAPGAVLVFARDGGGHVGFYVGEDPTHYHVLGGNQGNRVSIARIAKARLIASRWPKGEPVIGGPVALSANGLRVSRNEA